MIAAAAKMQKGECIIQFFRLWGLMCVRTGRVMVVITLGREPFLSLLVFVLRALCFLRAGATV